MPTFVSPTVPGASVASNDHVFDAYRRRTLEAEEKAAAVEADTVHQ
jgi:hypothetical protein